MEVYVLVPLYKKGNKEWKEVCAVYKDKERAEKMGEWLLTHGNEICERYKETEEDDLTCLSYEIEERMVID